MRLQVGKKTRKNKPPSGFIPAVMHKDKEVEGLITYLEPTKAQQAKRQALSLELEAERL